MLQTHATRGHSNGEGNKWQQFPDIWDHVGSISGDNTLAADTSANCPRKERPYRIDDLIKCVSRFLEPGLACFSIFFPLTIRTQPKCFEQNFWYATFGDPHVEIEIPTTYH